MANHQDRPSRYSAVFPVQSAVKPFCEDILKIERRCPRLGGPVAFGYCRIAAENQAPCFKVFDCWWERFDVVGYFRQRLPEEDFHRLRNARPPDKTATLVELIRQARQRTRS